MQLNVLDENPGKKTTEAQKLKLEKMYIIQCTLHKYWIKLIHLLEQQKC